MSAAATLAEPAVCPVRAVPTPGLQPGDRLHLPMHQRAFVQDAVSDDGRPERRLFYADKEVSFDEPELFRFAETLASQSRFAAADAVSWGEDLDWPRVRGLLEALLDAGILRRAESSPPDRPLGGDGAVRPNPLPPARTTVARSWHECPGLMQELTGRPLDIGYLEMVVPIFRVAHMAVDAEGRQVGEANAFPAPLRLDVPTRWRACIYAGSRFQDGKPMNVTALKAMRAHWGPMMAGLLRVREAYLRRFPSARAGWTVGHLERLSTAVLALPAWLLMRRDGRVGHGELHPVVSSMFRVTDGLRMTMHHMLFMPVGEPTRHPDAPMTAAEVHAYAERNHSFHSDHGVCAGPKAMIDEFLAVIVDGRLPKDGLPAALDLELETALGEIEHALDYALAGLQVYAAVFSLWPRMTRAYETLAAAAARWAAERPAAELLALRERFAAHLDQLRTNPFLAKEAWRADRDAVYADMHAQCALGLDGRPPDASLPDRLAVPDDPTDGAAELHALFARRFGDAGAGEGCAAFQAALLHFARQARQVLRTALDVQQRLNRHLGRDEPAHALTLDDLDLHIRLTGQHDQRLPFLPDELVAALGIRLHVDAERIVFEEHGVAA